MSLLVVFNVSGYYAAPGPVQGGESSQFYLYASPKIVLKFALKGFTICEADSIIRSSIHWRYREPPYSVTAEPHRVFFNMFETFYAFIKKLIVERSLEGPGLDLNRGCCQSWSAP